MLYCKDCKYSGKYNESFCNHPNNGISNVSGNPSTRFSAINRSTEQSLYEVTCGEGADWFESKDQVKEECHKWYSKFIFWKK